MSGLQFGMKQVGVINIGEAYSVLRSGREIFNCFVVNKRKKLAVYSRPQYASYWTNIRFKDARGSYTNGWIQSFDIFYYGDRLDESGTRLWYASTKRAPIVKARRTLNRYDGNGKHIGYIPSGCEIGFTGYGNTRLDGATCGINHPSWLRAKYYRYPNGAWKKINPSRSDGIGWVDTNVSGGMGSGWGIKHSRN